MLKKRIIPCLDIKNGRTVKGTRFVELRDAGDPVSLARRYEQEGADELVFLDITATVEGRSTFIELVEDISEHIRIPFTVGGGIDNIKLVERLLSKGADKISVNSAAVRDPKFVQSLANEFGSQCVVVAMDVNKISEEWIVFTHGGRKQSNWDAFSWAKEVESLGAGEILLTSMPNDGSKSGFALELTHAISAMIQIPIIASGGAGSMEDFKNVFTIGRADAALAASVFHYEEISIPDLKKYLINQEIPVRWN